MKTIKTVLNWISGVLITIGIVWIMIGLFGAHNAGLVLLGIAHLWLGNKLYDAGYELV